MTRRLEWDEYFMKIASIVAERSTCVRHHIGAVLVKDKRIITTGYNGAVKGMKHCIDLGCLRDKLKIPTGIRHEICRAVHAEQNAMISAQGINISNSSLYCTHTPCIICAKMIVNSEIKEVISYQDYSDNIAKWLLKKADITLRKMPRPNSKISFKD